MQGLVLVLTKKTWSWSWSCKKVLFTSLAVSAAGAKKRYGFVDFSNTFDEVQQIRYMLNGKTLQTGTVITCDAVPSRVVDYKQLLASCFCVKNLPADFADDDLLTKEFSVIAKPLFCHVSH